MPHLDADAAVNADLKDQGLLKGQGLLKDKGLRDELHNAPVEPLLPIEKKLIGWSLSIGLVLLVGLAAVNHLFPAAF